MENQSHEINEVLDSIAESITQLEDLMNSIDENKINTIPYEGSWTAPKLITHVKKSINLMSRVMQMEAKPADRDPGERIAELKKTFLNFTNKFNAPELIIPEDGIYERQLTIDKLNEAFQGFKENARDANLNEIVDGQSLGPITKLEIIHFTLFHTMRHLHQMEKICEALKSK
ncbi:MAG: DinB family protein [Ginsengibacter sp.]